MTIKNGVSKISNRRKVSIIGTGYVGSTIAYSILMKSIAREIVLIDINQKASQGEAEDIRHGIPYMGDADVKSGSYEDIVDSDLIIITAGRNRRSDETRLEMANDNVTIIDDVIKEIKKYYNKGVILVVTNPVDIITYNVSKRMGVEKNLVLGTGCILDASRLINILAEYLHISPYVINAQIVGEHGESQVIIWSKVTIGGISIEEYCKSTNFKFDENIKKEIAKKVIGKGSNIIENKGKTHYGIATCVCYIADAILNKRPMITNVTSVLKGEYGVNNVALSVPTIVGGNGVEHIIEEKWDEKEYTFFLESYKKVRNILLNRKVNFADKNM